MRAAPTLEQVLEPVLAGDGPAVARAISLAERGEPTAAGLLAAVGARVGRAFRVGVTGPGGAGKSSLLREVARRLRRGGERVALVACDPVSPVSGGAFFGDRLRMASLLEDPGIFFRSVGHRGPSGEPCWAALAALDILDAAGFPWVFLETVGTGQAEVGALRGLRLKVLLHASESGDEVQMLKAGLAETADLHVVSKGDRHGAASWASELAAALSPQSGPPARVLVVSASTGEGVDELVGEIRRRRDAWRGVPGAACTGDPKGGRSP
ncbi:MAG: methylmalonyl Co-A mutase-associated GTPase MeaB [Planctomycetes bacterium]|nr:methylmalonyl Co-A mutase-associated GTPase MeaB [Planctomycetota bacterium]